AAPPTVSALRSASLAAPGPMLRYVISAVTPDSTTCSACSTAYSSSSESRPGTAARSTVESAANLRGAVASGTCLTRTTIFKNSSLRISPARCRLVWNPGGCGQAQQRRQVAAQDRFLDLGREAERPDPGDLGRRLGHRPAGPH